MTTGWAASFTRDSRRFNYRVAGLCLHEDHALVHRAESEDFWSLPGGRPVHGEPSDVALRRELAEEIEADGTIVRLLWVVENFFSYLGVEHHELAFYYLFDLPAGSPLLAKDREHEGREGDDLRLIFRWFPVAGLPTLRLYPSFLRTGVAALPATVAHLIHYDEDA